jgi:hypothetical protein
MNVLMVTSKVKEENVADAEAAVARFFEALEQAKPQGVRYSVTKLGDGVTIVAFLEMEPGQEHPLRTLPAYGELLKAFESWRAEPAVADQMTVLGSYGLFSA